MQTFGQLEKTSKETLIRKAKVVTLLLSMYKTARAGFYEDFVIAQKDYGSSADHDPVHILQRFRLPPDASRIHRWIAGLLKDRLKAPGNVPPFDCLSYNVLFYKCT